MANVTYLLGAGASYDALPIVNELDDQIGLTIAVLTIIKEGRSSGTNPRNYNIFNISSDPTYRAIAENAIINLGVLRQGCKDHLSVDTYLKMLFLTKNSQYEKMKTTMVLFFCLHQCLHTYLKDFNKEKAKQDLVDKRYDSFFASILQNSFDKFPDNIKILSWNYDNQFEKAYHKYLQYASSTSTIDQLLNIYHKNEKDKNFKSLKFAIYKINGSASYFNSDDNKLSSQVNTKNEDINVSLRRILNEYNECINNNSLIPAISFSWDEPIETKKMIDDILFSILHTEILVLIGYSMPFFNRNVDSELLNKNAMPKLRKIYVQDTAPDGVIEKLQAIRSDLTSVPYTNAGGIRIPANILPVNDVTQFYLPDEL